MVGQSQVFITRNDLNSKQFETNEVIISNNNDDPENDSNYFDQAAELLILMYIDSDNLYEIELDNSAEKY